MKRVLFVSQAIGQDYLNIIKEALGHDVAIDIITGSDIANNHIVSPAHDSRNIKSRFLCWVKHYVFIKTFIRRNKNEKYDLIYCVSNPPINSYVGLCLKKQFHAPFLYMNWDIYPQVIESKMPGIVSKIICKLWQNWNNRNYPKIDNVLTIGDCMASVIQKSITTDIKLNVIPIAVDTDRIKPIPRNENKFIKENDLEGKFIVLYSGKMGLGHDIELILEAADYLQDQRDIVFVFIGGGQKSILVKSYISIHNPNSNVKYFEYQSNEMFPYSIACGNLGIVTVDQAFSGLMMPSKTYSLMATGTPVIGITSSKDDLVEVIEKNNIGISIKQHDARVFAKQIMDLKDNKLLLEMYGKNGRKVAEEKYDNKVIVELYRELFNSVLK